MLKYINFKKIITCTILFALFSYGIIYCILNDLAVLGNKDNWTKEETKRVDLYMRGIGYASKCIPPLGPLKGFKYASKIGFSYLDKTLPDNDTMNIWRDVVLSAAKKEKNNSFKQKLIDHEKIAFEKYKNKGKLYYEKKIIQKITFDQYGIPLHDYWEIYLRTDIVNGSPKTDFIVAGMGIVVDKRNHKFLGNQAENYAKLFNIKGEDLFKWMYHLERKGLAKPYWVIITGHKSTSQFSHKDVYISKNKKLDRWRKSLKQINKENKGMSVEEMYK